MTVWVWMIFGFLGQALFSMRFLLQWWSSERAGMSVMPQAFWRLSILGGMTLLIYAIYMRDPVFILGQSLGILIYFRNLQLIRAGGDD